MTHSVLPTALIGRCHRVAIVGAGPAGLYTAEALLKAPARVAIDVIEGLPAPFGLVRYGVAPDHLKIKSIARVLSKVFDHPDVRFVGNVTHDVDVSFDDLRERYDAVIYAIGAGADRQLGIPGMTLPGSRAAAEFVAWYNAHPNAGQVCTLPGARVAVIGAGNVALDVTRMLTKPLDALATTDMPRHVLATLAASPVTDVYVVARRGPAQAKFTPIELRELGELPGVDVLVSADVLAIDSLGRHGTELSKATRTNIEILQGWSQRELTGAPKRIHLLFWRRPAAVLGQDAVAALRLERTVPDGANGAKGSGEFETLPTDAVLRSVGYRGLPVSGLPFDAATATMPNQQGRVVDPSGRTVPGAYVAGWIKRGPTGVIGTNKGDAAETARSVLADLAALEATPERGQDSSVTTLLEHRNLPYVSWDGWRRLDAYEIGLGRAAGKERVKVADRATMLRVALPAVRERSAS